MGRKVTIVELIRREGREPGGRSRRKRTRWIPMAGVIEQGVIKPGSTDGIKLRFVGRASFGG